MIWHIFLSPIEFSEKKGPLATLSSIGQACVHDWKRINAWAFSLSCLSSLNKMNPSLFQFVQTPSRTGLGLTWPLGRAGSRFLYYTLKMYDFAKNALGSFELELAVRFLNPNICIELPTPALNHNLKSVGQRKMKYFCISEMFPYKKMKGSRLSRFSGVFFQSFILGSKNR